MLLDPVTKMTKVVYNNCYGGFGLSDKAVLRIAELKGITLYQKPDKFGSNFYTSPEMTEESYFSMYALGDDRTDPHLVQAVEELGEEASGPYADLVIQEIEPGPNIVSANMMVLSMWKQWTT